MPYKSDCCGAEVDSADGYETDICAWCGEHCEYIEEECEECGGSGQLAIGHPSDPDCDYRPCDYCQPEPDPDTRDR